MRIKIIGRGTYKNRIKEACGFNYLLSNTDLVINYGLQGGKLQEYERRYGNLDSANRQVLNHRMLGNKYDHICMVRDSNTGILVPLSCRRPNEYPMSERPDGFQWIRKPYYSLGGRGIHLHGDDEPVPSSHYVQEFISNRKYELRVHAMRWVPVDEWLVAKRVHDDGANTIAWNHHNGGRFITVNDSNVGVFSRAKAASATLLTLFRYDFGALDFVVFGDSNTISFLEINMAPGFDIERTTQYYISMFNRLSALSSDELSTIVEGRMNGVALCYEPNDATPANRRSQRASRRAA